MMGYNYELSITGRGRTYLVLDLAKLPLPSNGTPFNVSSMEVDQSFGMPVFVARLLQK